MIIGSHNTMTYLTPSKWWMKPLARFAKCQDKSLKEQIQSGVKCFDIRIRFDKYGKAYLCHGLITYRANVWEVLTTISSSLEEGYIRLGFEGKPDPIDLDMFLKFSRAAIEQFPNIKFSICIKKPEWTILQDNFHTLFIELQTVPTWKNIWKTPKGLLKEQELLYLKLRTEAELEEPVILSMDFV